MKDKRIPTIIGTVLLISIIFIGVYLSLRQTNTVSKASDDCAPQGVQITNLTNKSADISFQTTSMCSTSVNINNKIISNFIDKSNIHYFRIDGLTANINYQFFITADNQEHHQSSYTFQTAPMPSGELSTANLAWGKVLTESGKASKNSIVYVNIPEALPLSALTDSNGQWHISLSNSFTVDKKSQFIPPETGTEEIIIFSSDNKTTQVENSLSKNDPVPDITIGLGFDDGLGTGPAPTTVPTKIITPTTIILNTKLSIDSPVEGESIVALKPDIFGQGKSNSTVNLSIDTDIVGTTTSKSDGTWHWSPEKNLSLGKHMLTVTLGNELLQRKFTVATVASNSSPLSFSATPSATIIPLSTPTELPTLVPTTRTQKISTSSGIPVTGNSSPLYYLLLSSLLTVSFSLYFFYKDEK